MSEIIGLSIKVQADQAIESVGSIKKAMREAQKEVQVLSDKFGATSKEATNAAKVAAELKDRIGDAKALTEAFNPDAKFKSLSASLSGVAGGFAAVQGSMALFGSESENVQKTLLKVQSAMALSQGLQAVGESIDSFKQLGVVIKTQVVSAFSTLRGAIIATGLGALAVGLGLLIANFDAVKKAVLNLVPGLADVGEWIGKLVNKFTDFIGVTSEADRELDKLKKNADATLKLNEKFMKEHGDQVDEYTRKKIEAKNRYLEAIKEDGANVAELGKRLNREIDAADAEREAKQEERRKEAAEKRKKERDKIEKEIADENERRKALELKFFFDRLKAIDDLNAQRAKEKAEQDAADKELLEQGQKDAEEYFDKQFQATQLSIKNQKATADAATKTAQEEAAAKVAALDATANAMATLSVIAGRETVAGKALAVAASIINTYAAIAKTLNAFAGVPVPGYAIAQAIATGVAGLAAVKQIVSVQVPGGGGGGSAPSAPNLNAGSPLQPTTVASNQVTLDQRSINAMGNRAIKAYVVETEISGTQEKIRRIQKQTTFG